MGVPTISSTSPADNAVNVYRNKILQATFSEALRSATVSTRTFLLRNVDTNQLVDCTVNLSTSGLVVSIEPTRVLAENTSYLLTIVGEDVGGGDGSVESSSTSDELVLTARISFQTGTEIDTPTITKSEADIEAEGDLGLPSNVQVVEESEVLEITATTPANRDFGVARTLSAITVTFDDDVDPDTVDEGTFQVTIEPYYEEDELMIAVPSDDGLCNFKFQEHTDTSGNPYDYSDLDGELSVSGDTITWTPESARDFPSNVRVRVVLGSDLASDAGLTLGDNYYFTFYIDPCPNLVSVDRIRDSFFPLVLSAWTDDMIGKTIYKNTMDVLPRIRWQIKHDKIYPRLAEYVLYKTIDDIYQGIQIETELKAGQFKKLGDLMIRYDTKNAGNMVTGHRMAVERWKRALEEVTRRYVGVAVPFIKGYQDAEQRCFWRTRLWQADIASSLQRIYTGGELAGNTARQRGNRVSGAMELWR